MTLLINCQRCGQMHLIGYPCRPEALFNENERKHRLCGFSFEGDKMKNKTFLAIDFDGMIANKINDALVLVEGAKEALVALKNANCYILIDSNRANSYRKKEGTVERSLNEMKQFLDDNQIPYDAIAGLTFKLDGKPISDWYLGKNNIEVVSWKDTVKRLIGVDL